MIKFLKSNLFFLIILVSFVFIVYGKSINYDFTGIDDDALSSKKSLYISDIKNFPNFFLTDCYHNKKVTQYYRPILSLSFAIETILFGVNTKIYHLTNIILFILALYLMYLFLCKLCLNNVILKYIILLFSVHPIFVSSVVWLPARNDTLLSIFLFLFFIMFINYIKENKISYFLLSSIFFTIALFTKETTVIILIVLLLLIHCFDLKITKKQILNYLFVFVPILLAYFILRYFAVDSIHFKHYIKNFYEYLINIFYGTMLYIKYIFVVDDIPIMLNFLKFDVVAFVINAFSMFLLLYLYIFKIINRKIIIFNFLLFILFLLPSFAQEYYTWLSHRFMFPVVSIIFIFTEIINKLFLKYIFIKKYIFFLFLILIISFSFSSWLQADKYKNSKIFSLNAYENSPKNHIAMSSLADIYIENKEYDKAKELILETLQIRSSVEYYLKLTTIEYLINNDLDLAEQNYFQCLEYAGTYYYKASILARLSEIYYLKKDLNKAIEYAEKSLELQPYDKHTLLYLANYYALNKQFSKARPIYERLLKDDNNNEYYHYLIKTLDEDERENKTN